MYTLRITVILFSALATGCRDVAECPTGEDAFQPQVGPEACLQPAQTSMEWTCPGGIGYDAATDFIAVCPPDGPCAPEYVSCPCLVTEFDTCGYCVSQSEWSAWLDAHCPDCRPFTERGEGKGTNFGGTEWAYAGCSNEAK